MRHLSRLHNPPAEFSGFLLGDCLLHDAGSDHRRTGNVPFDDVPPRPVDYLYTNCDRHFAGGGKFPEDRSLPPCRGDRGFSLPLYILIWAMLVGFLVFGDVPGIWTLTGAVVIVASGLFIWYRERVRGKAAEDASI